MQLPGYLDWARSDDGRWWLRRLRIKWTIQSEARRVAAEEAEKRQADTLWKARGWRGGETDPALVSNVRDA